MGLWKCTHMTSQDKLGVYLPHTFFRAILQGMLRALILWTSVRIFITLEWARRIEFNILKVYRLGLRNPELCALTFTGRVRRLSATSIEQTDRFLRRPFVSSTRPSCESLLGGSYTECLAWSLRSASLRPLLYCSRPQSMNKRAINNVSLSTSIHHNAREET